MTKLSEMTDNDYIIDVLSDGYWQLLSLRNENHNVSDLCDLCLNVLHISRITPSSKIYLPCIDKYINADINSLSQHILSLHHLNSMIESRYNYRMCKLCMNIAISFENHKYWPINFRFNDDSYDHYDTINKKLISIVSLRECQ